MQLYTKETKRDMVFNSTVLSIWMLIGYKFTASDLHCKLIFLIALNSYLYLQGLLNKIQYKRLAVVCVVSGASFVSLFLAGQSIEDKVKK